MAYQIPLRDWVKAPSHRETSTSTTPAKSITSTAGIATRLCRYLKGSR